MAWSLIIFVCGIGSEGVGLQKNKHLSMSLAFRPSSALGGQTQTWMPLQELSIWTFETRVKNLGDFKEKYTDSLPELRK